MFTRLTVSGSKRPQCTPWFSLRQSPPASPWSPPRSWPRSSRGTCPHRSGRWDRSSRRQSPRWRLFWRSGSWVAEEPSSSGSRTIQPRSRSLPCRAETGAGWPHTPAEAPSLPLPGERKKGGRFVFSKTAAFHIYFQTRTVCKYKLVVIYERIL